MNALNIFWVILIVGVKVENIYGQVPSGPGVANPEGPNNPAPTPPKCYKCFRNINGMCKRLETPCDFNEELHLGGIDWTPTYDANCAQRDLEEVKVCSLDCQNIYRIGRCPSTLNPVCAYSIKTKRCRKFANPCLLKQDACRNRTIKDWRVTHLTKCQNLSVGGPAGSCA